MKIIIAEALIPEIIIETSITDVEKLSEKEIKDLLFEELIEELPGANVDFLYEIKEEENEE